MNEFYAVTLTGLPHNSYSWGETVEATKSEVSSAEAIQHFVSKCTRNACGFGHPWFEGQASATIRYKIYEPSGMMIKDGDLVVTDLPQHDAE